MTPATQYTYTPQPVTSQPAPPPDPYRSSPTTVNNAMSLPSMRTLEPLHGSNPMPNVPSLNPVYYVSPQTYGMHPDPSAVRYTYPDHLSDPRIALSGGRNKKEIKRRTKTGCLTCRKRRIKCDEAHPTCNNCKKSKRECLGYDPIFKQQPNQSAIQPALNSEGSVSASAPVPIPASAPGPGLTALVSPPTVPSSTSTYYHHLQHPPAASSSFPPATTLPGPAVNESPPAPAIRPARSEGGLEYSAAIDPALGEVDLSAAASQSHYQPVERLAAGAPLRDQRSGFHTGLRGGTPFPVDPLQALLHFSCYYLPKEITFAHSGVPAKNMKIDELVSLGGMPPPPQSVPPGADVVEEIARLYTEIYAPGLASFFESDWYQSSRGQLGEKSAVSLLRESEPVARLFASFLQSIMQIKTTDPADMAYPGHLETCLVWGLARLAQPLPGSSDTPQSSAPFPAVDDGAAEVRSRLVVFEALVSGETLQSNPLTPPPATPGDKPMTPIRPHELEFWYYLAQYVQQSHSSSTPADCSTRGHWLSRIRSVLDGRENRDVLYSIAILREYAPHFDATLNEQTVPAHLDEKEPRSKLAVATRFIRDEASSTGGTTNVVRRFADIAYRAFVRPGVNVGGNVQRG